MRLFETSGLSASSSPLVEIALRDGVRDARWSEAVAVGSLAFVEKVKSELGIRELHRQLEQVTTGSLPLRILHPYPNERLVVT
jgi:hypothetical protein